MIASPAIAAMADPFNELDIMDHAFWCGHVGVTLEYFFYYPSVYDLHWSHYYSEVIHIQNNLVF